MKDNKDRGRYEYDAGDGYYGVVAYRHTGNGDLIITHTEIPEELEGKGVASRMMKAVLEDIEAQGRKVIPQCPFSRNYIQRHPEWERIVGERY